MDEARIKASLEKMHKKCIGRIVYYLDGKSWQSLEKIEELVTPDEGARRFRLSGEGRQEKFAGRKGHDERKKEREMRGRRMLLDEVYSRLSDGICKFKDSRNGRQIRLVTSYEDLLQTRRVSIPPDGSMLGALSQEPGLETPGRLYAGPGSEKSKELQAAAERIRQLVKNTVLAVIEIGVELKKVKDMLPHGQWQIWLRDQFSWSDRKARNCMAVAERLRSKTEIISDSGIQVTAAYALAKDDTPESVIDEALARASNGEIITEKLVKQLKNAARKQGRKPKLGGDSLPQLTLASGEPRSPDGGGPQAGEVASGEVEDAEAGELQGVDGKTHHIQTQVGCEPTRAVNLGRITELLSEVSQFVPSELTEEELHGLRDGLGKEKLHFLINLLNQLVGTQKSPRRQVRAAPSAGQ